MDTKKPSPDRAQSEEKTDSQPVEREVGGFENKKEPTRYGDWEVNGRCSDF